jgi:hypothetical protein
VQNAIFGEAAGKVEKSKSKSFDFLSNDQNDGYNRGVPDFQEIPVFPIGRRE